MKNPVAYKAGGTRGTNTADIVLTARLIVEAGLDDRSRASVASFDIEAFFDNVPLGKLVKTAVTRSWPQQLFAFM